MTDDQLEVAQARRKELREEAYFLVLKAFMFRDKPDMVRGGEIVDRVASAVRSWSQPTLS